MGHGLTHAPRETAPCSITKSAASHGVARSRASAVHRGAQQCGSVAGGTRAQQPERMPVIGYLSEGSGVIVYLIEEDFVLVTTFYKLPCRDP
jgi:hypothetical protein